jgi:DNA adenine methylase
MKSPIKWMGGKGNFVKKLIPYTKVEHMTYLEPFGGGGSLLFAKEPSGVECFNDLNSDLVNFFRVLRSEEQFKQFCKTVNLIPYSREEYNLARETYTEGAPVERAVKFFLVARMSFGGLFCTGFGRSITASYREMSSETSKYLSTIDRLPEIHERLMRVQIENQDFRKLIPAFDRETTLIYCDPPYAILTRNTTTAKYQHEMSDQDHIELVNILLGLKSKCFVSCYFNSTYQPLLDAGWFKKDWQTSCNLASRTKKKWTIG